MTTFQDAPDWEEPDEVSSCSAHGQMTKLNQWLKEVEERWEKSTYFSNPEIFIEISSNIPLLLKMLKRAVEALHKIDDLSRGLKVHYAGDNGPTQGLDLLFEARKALADLEEMVK